MQPLKRKKKGTVGQRHRYCRIGRMKEATEFATPFIFSIWSRHPLFSLQCPYQFEFGIKRVSRTPYCFDSCLKLQTLTLFLFKFITLQSDSPLAFRRRPRPWPSTLFRSFTRPLSRLAFCVLHCKSWPSLAIGLILFTFQLFSISLFLGWLFSYEWLVSVIWVYSWFYFWSFIFPTMLKCWRLSKVCSVGQSKGYYFGVVSSAVG